MDIMELTQRDKENIKKMRALLARPYGWTKGRLVKANNRVVGEDKVNDGWAYCLLGATQEVSSDVSRVRIQKAMRVKVNEMGYFSVAAFNDRKTTRKKDVLTFLDELAQ
jgi:hypothetical protein